MNLQKQLFDLEEAIVAKKNEAAARQRELQILQDARIAVAAGKDIFHSGDMQSVTVRVLMQQYKKTCI